MAEEILLGLQEPLKSEKVQITLKLCIQLLCFKPYTQILESNQVSSASHSPVWFVTFMTSVKAFKTAKMCLILLKYCF